VLHAPFAEIVFRNFFRFAEQRTGDKVSPLGILSILVGATHGEPANNNKAQSEVRNENVRYLQFITDKGNLVALFGAAVTLVGLFLLGKGVVSYFGFALVCTGIFASLYGPDIFVWWTK
jgi:hypothetical protein